MERKAPKHFRKLIWKFSFSCKSDGLPSSLLRDIKLKPTRGTAKSTAEEEFIRDGRKLVIHDSMNRELFCFI